MTPGKEQAALLDALDGGAIALDSHGVVQHWNGWIARATGIPAHAVTGRRLFDALPDLGRTRLFAAVEDAIIAGAPAVLTHTLNPFLFPLQGQDGRRLVHSVTVRPLHGVHGLACLIQVTDVTAWVDRERVLREQRDARYRAIVDTAPDTMVTADVRGTIQWVNGAGLRQFGYLLDELVGRGVADILDGAPDMADLFRTAAGAAGAAEPIEVTGRRKDGSSIALELSVGRWEAEGRRFVTCILRDITERRRAQDSLKDSALANRQMAEQLKGTLDALPAHIAVLDRDGRIASVNAAWVAAGASAPFLGASSGVGDDYLQAHCDGMPCAASGPLFATLRSLLADGGPPVSMEYDADSPDGPRWYRCLAAPMEAAPFGGAVVMHIDITEIKAMEEVLRKLLGEKSMLLREVNHRVKNSLQLVSSLLLLQTMNLSDEVMRNHFRDARNRIEAIARVHNRLYQTEHFETVEFASYLGELCADLERASGGASACRIALTAEPADLPIDQAAPLGLIANELVTNAVKHRGDDPAEVAVALRRDGPALVLTVTDQGPGLPPGFDLKRSKSLGLRIINGLAGQIGATVTQLNSARGAVFQVVVPDREPGVSDAALAAGAGR